MTVDDDRCGFVALETVDANGVLDPGETWTYTCAMALGHDTTNIVTVDAEDSLGNPWEDTASAFVDVLRPGLLVRKAVDQAIVYVDGDVVYTIEVENPGIDPLLSVVVDDSHCSPLVGPSGDAGTPNVLDGGEVWTYTCTTKLSMDTLNTVTVTAEDALEQGYEEAASADVNVIDPQINVVKSVDRSVTLAGGRVVYSYVVTNPGDDPLSNVAVSDDKCAPLGLTGGDADHDGQLDPGEIWLYTCSTIINLDTTNAVTATGDDSLGNEKTDGDTKFVDVVAPAIEIVKTADRTTVLANELVTYTYVVTNTGDTPLSGVAPTDNHCAPVLRTPDVDPNGNGRLDPDEVWTYQCQAQVGQDTTNVATVSGQPTDAAGVALPSIDPVTDSDDETVDVIRPRIAIDKTVDKPIIYAGTMVTYTYAVTNTGDVPLAFVALDDDLCETITQVLPSGDVNSNGRLDLTETWVYRCQMLLNGDATNTVDVEGLPVSGTGEAFDGIGEVTADDTARVDVINPGIVIVKTARSDGHQPR